MNTDLASGKKIQSPHGHPAPLRLTIDKQEPGAIYFPRRFRFSIAQSAGSETVLLRNIRQSVAAGGLVAPCGLCRQPSGPHRDPITAAPHHLILLNLLSLSFSA
jgi:hypothetical protein